MIQFGNKEASGITIGGKEVQKIEIGGKTAYEKETIDYFYIENKYSGVNTLTVTSVTDGTPTSGKYATSLEYSKNGSAWSTLTFDTTTAPTIVMSSGEKVYFRNTIGYFNIGGSSSNYYHTSFQNSQNCSVGGDILTLLDYRNIETISRMEQNSFYGLFENNTKLTDASGLKLPNFVSVSCYYYFFKGCSNLNKSPQLPATILETSCYQRMYQGCTKLQTAPELHATVLVTNCYNYMFYTSKVNNVTVYANDISAIGCTSGWLQGASRTGTVYNNGSATYTTSSTSGIPTGWTEDTSNRFVFSNTVITDVGNNQAELTSDIQINYTGTWDDGYFEVYNELDKNRSVHFSPSDITNGVLTAANLISESNVATLVSPATVTIYNSGTAVWTGSVSFTVVQ